MASGNFTFPQWSSLNFSRNCTITAQFLRSWWESPVGAGPEINTLFRYYRDALPPSYPQPTNGQTADWFYYTRLNRTQFGDNVLFGPRQACTAEFCAALPFKGNPDIAGVGMLIVYAMEASMASAYLIAFLSSKNLRHLNSASTATRRHARRAISIRLLDAFTGTVGLFFNTALLFSFAMFIAAIFVASGNIQGIQFFSSKHSIVLSTLMSNFSAAVVLSVWPLHLPALRRKSLRLCTGIALSILLIIEAYITTPANNEDDWEINCYPIAGSSYRYALMALFLAPMTSWILSGCIFLGKKFLRRFKIFRSCALPRLPFDTSRGWIISAYGFISTWALFAIFVVLRQQIKSAVGDSYEENEWGFGQVLAIGTWVPVIIEFLYIFFYGPKEGLEGRLPKPWNVHIEAIDNIPTPEDLQPLQSSDIEDEPSVRDSFDLGSMNVPPARARTT